jgi:succinate dehydrogenase/fumarate reductase flavoprotein subunit
MKSGEDQIKNVSRRNFIKSAAAGLGTTAFVGLGSGQAKATQLTEVPRWDYEAEVVILGIGASGLVTAITARDLGADVLILEKAPEAYSGGNSRVCGQGSWCPTDFDNAVAYQTALSDGYPVPDDMIRAFHEYSIQTEEWIEKMGGKMRIAPSKGEFPELAGEPGTVICWPIRGQGDYVKLYDVLKNNAVKRNIKIMYETPGVELVQDVKTKEVKGVVAERQGKRIYVKAKKAVALCTGGFENNQEMIRDYLLMPCGYPKGSPYNTGDGIKMAQAIGADLWHMDNQAGPDLNFRPPDAGWAFGYVFRPPGKGYIWIAKDATRFVDETISTKHGKIPFHGTYVPLPTPLPVHVIFDEAMRKSGPFYSSGRGGMCWYNVIEEYKWSEDSSVELGKGWILKADNIRDLAGKIGKNSDTLEKTVATWNRSCESGNDTEFGRPTKQMAPIKSPPYYAMELVPSFTNTQGGPRRNKNAQVLDTNHKPIPRLYSGGELGSIYSYHYQGGGNILECIAFGRIAGERTAAEKSWS